MKKKILSILALGSLVACVVPQQVVYYDFAIAPEEGPLKMTQITQADKEAVYGPLVSKSTTGISWDAKSLIDITPEGDEIIYLSTRGEQVNLFTRSTEGGSSVKQLTHRDNISAMAFSPNGEKIAYSDFSSGNGDIYLMNKNGGGGMTQLTNSSSNEFSPFFSIDGKIIYYIRSSKITGKNGAVFQRYYIWGIDLETSQKTQYCEGFSGSMYSTIEEPKIIFTRANNKTNLGEIWTLDINSGQETLLLQDSERGFSTPLVSPDGKKIVCVASSPKTASIVQNIDIYMCNIDGSKLIQKTYHPETDASPKWSPDSKYVYFLSTRINEDHKFSLWIMNSNNRD